MTALAQVRALRPRPWWVPTLLLLLALALLALYATQVAVLIVLDVAERLIALACAAVSLLLALSARGGP